MNQELDPILKWRYSKRILPTVLMVRPNCPPIKDFRMVSSTWRKKKK